MWIKIEPTPELYEAPINETMVPCRIWKGVTQGGVEIEAYVLSITPNNKAGANRLRRELPPFMKPSRDTFKIGLNE